MHSKSGVMDHKKFISKNFFAVTDSIRTNLAKSKNSMRWHTLSLKKLYEFIKKSILGNNNIGGSSQTGGANWGQHILPDNYGSSRNPNCPPGGSSQSNRGNYDPSCYWSQSGYGHDHVHGDHQSSSKPPYDNNNNGLSWNNQRRVKRTAGRTVQFKVAPPFHGEFIEAVIPVKPCKLLRCIYH